MSCGNHYDAHHLMDGVPHEHVDEHMEEHFLKDMLTPEKAYKEMRDDEVTAAYGIDKYRSEAQWENLDRLDSSIKSLSTRRESQAKGLLQIENNKAIRWKDAPYTRW